MQVKRLAYPLWILFLTLFAAVHFSHLSADFPNFSPWEDWSKYTDEGWYGNAAIRAHLFGGWYVPGDFNPAPAVPVWPALEWLVFAVTGVKIEAARALSVSFFLLNLVLSYKLFRERGPRWVGLFAVTLLVTSPFLYAFSRLAILEPLLLALTLGAMNLAIRLPRFRHQEGVSALIGLIFTGMLLTKTTAVFLLPALAWMIGLPFWNRKRELIRILAAAGFSSAISFALWMLLVVSNNLFADYKYLFFINVYKKPHGIWNRLLSFWWSFHGGLWIDIILIPLAGMLFLAALSAWRHGYAEEEEPVEHGLSEGGRGWMQSFRSVWSSHWTGGLWMDPLFSGSLLAVAGYIAFMTYQNHPQPRYYAVVAFFCFFILVRVTAQLLYQPALTRRAGVAVLAMVIATVAVNSVWTLGYVLHPQYTFVEAANNLTRYMDEHPNGNRLLLSISGDQITLVTHVPSLCDDFGTSPLPDKIDRFKPGWYATWNDLDPGTLEDIHIHDSLEQVAAFPAFDDPERNVLYLFKLHPLPDGQRREYDGSKLEAPLPEDKIGIPVE